MKIEPEQEGILRGDSGKAMALAMKTLVEYGKAFGAQRLVPIKSAHLAGTFASISSKAYYKVLDQLIAGGARVKVLTTLNPRPGHDLNLINRLTFSKQKYLDEAMKTLGVTLNYSCVCYEHDNVPAFGDCVAWAESSAVQFANSVLGARTNRNSILIDLCSAVTGLTPEFGYLLDEHRRGEILIKLAINKMDPSALGFLIGRKVVTRVPVIEHYEFSRIDLKNMGGAMAAAGGVALFHVEGLTPEAPDMKAAFGGNPKETLTITQAELDSLRYKQPDQADMVVFGCPQMTYEEVMALAEKFAGKRIQKSTWFCLAPEAKQRFEQTERYRKVREAGVEVYSHCPLAALTVQIGRKLVLSPSGKLYYYLEGSEYGNMDDCLKACGVML